MAKELKTIATIELMEPTMFAAAIAASPVEATMAVESMLMKMMKNWSTISVKNIPRSCG